MGPTLSDGSTSMTLIARAQDGDPDAWNKIAEVYAPLVHARCQRLGFTVEEADDLSQDVFFGAFRNLGQFRKEKPGHGFRNWLRTILKHKIIDFVERRQHEVRAAGGSTAQQRQLQIPDPFDDEAGWEAQQWQNDTLKSAIPAIQASIDERTWQVFERLVLEDRSVREVAEEFGMREGTVRQVKHKLLKKLRKQFGDVMDLPEGTTKKESDESVS